MDEASDEELMAQVAKGDAAAFRRLATRYLPQAVRLAYRINGAGADAEDIAQEALLRVWTAAPRWRPAALFRTWLYRIVLNLCLNRRRRMPFAALETAGDPADPAPDAADRIERDEVDRLVEAAIGGLPDRQRAAITLTYQQGLSNAESAAVLGTSVSGVETLLVRAKRALRAKLGPLLGATNTAQE
jgi:RNA polymerase sigma-70 factor (ECF subfamily)